MIKDLVDFYDNSPEMLPVGHTTRTPELALQVSSQDGEASVTANTESFVYPKPPRTGLASNPALACDQIKYMTGFTGNDRDRGILPYPPRPPLEGPDTGSPLEGDQVDLTLFARNGGEIWFTPVADRWATNKFHGDYFGRLQSYIDSLSAPASDALKTLRGVLTPRLRARLIEASDETHNAYVVVFVDGEPLLQPGGEEPTQLQHQIQEANAQLKLDEMSTGNEVSEPIEGTCSTCGNTARIAAKHSKFKGKSLINADEPAYRSHGHKQSITTGICVSCAVKYPAALEHMADEGSRVVYSRSEDTDLQWFFFSPERPDASTGLFTSVIKGQVGEQEARRVFTALRKGEELPEVSEVSIIAIGNTTQRMAFRYGRSESPNALADNLSSWIDRQGKSPIGVAEHCRNISPSTSSGDGEEQSGEGSTHSRLRGDLSKVPEATYDAVVRAAISGQTLPLYHLKPLLARLANAQAELRSYSLNNVIPTIRLAVDMDQESIAFKLGKLLSLSDYVYWLADDKGLQMSQRYYTSLSTQPGRSFGMLCRDVRTRLTQLLNKNKEDLDAADGPTGKAKWADKEITGLITEMGEVPRSLSSRQQAQFALGYHHGRQQRFSQDEGENQTDSSSSDSEGEDSA
ncbi:MAG: type I-C CRISPR-associated protein Cas8c/Csd1 [Salinibacter sp.]